VLQIQIRNCLVRSESECKNPPPGCSGGGGSNGSFQPEAVDLVWFFKAVMVRVNMSDPERNRKTKTV
jgi:hypothetical protein